MSRGLCVVRNAGCTGHPLHTVLSPVPGPPAGGEPTRSTDHPPQSLYFRAGDAPWASGTQPAPVAAAWLLPHAVAVPKAVPSPLPLRKRGQGGQQQRPSGTLPSGSPEGEASDGRASAHRAQGTPLATVARWQDSRAHVKAEPSGQVREQPPSGPLWG